MIVWHEMRCERKGLYFLVFRREGALHHTLWVAWSLDITGHRNRTWHWYALLKQNSGGDRAQATQLRFIEKLHTINELSDEMDNDGFEAKNLPSFFQIGDKITW
jgi:hypothetical protein